MSDIKIGDRVTTKCSGPMAVGTVIALYDPTYYMHVINPQSLVNPQDWESDYPEWREDVVAMILYDQPIRALTKEEYINLPFVYQQHMSQRHLDIGYKLMPGYSVATTPLANLSLIDEMDKVR